MLKIMKVAMYKMVEKQKRKILKKEMNNIKRVNNRVPTRPFQAPPKVIDMTKDVMYDQRWVPLTIRNPSDPPRNFVKETE